ncbi:MAG TPA: LPS export ABC transporter permease LptF [Xanthobacteraceae bacterium]
MAQPTVGKSGPMGSIGRYMFRTTMGAFLITVVSLTIVIWFTQAMRDFDLITSQRQTLFVFIGITGLIIPLLVMMIAPIALVMAVAHVLNKLSSDSEIIVMNAAGVSPWRLLAPFLLAALTVSVLVAAIAAYISPRSLRELREWAAQVRADILTNIVQPGRFTTVGGNLTFHIADRRQNGLLIGIFVDDRRDPTEHATYLAEQGEIVKNDNGSFLVLQGGSIQRIEAGQRDPRIVTFDRYAFDLSKFTGSQRNVVYTVREKYLWELLWPRRDDALYVAQPDQYRSELADRLAAPLYPFAFVILAYTFLGPPQTTRQSRTLALLATIGAVSLLRLTGFVSVIVGVRVPSVLAVQYVALFGTIAAGLWQISRGQAVEPADAVSKLATAIGERVARATS